MEYGIKNVVPSYFSIEEGALSLIAESELAFTEMMKEIGISELHSFEESGIVMEAANVKETINKIINWFKEAFESFKGYLDDALWEIKKRIDAQKRNILNQDKIKAAVENLKPDKEYGKTYEYKELGWARSLESTSEQSHWKAVLDYRKAVIKAYEDKDDDIKNIVDEGKKKLDERFGASDSDRKSAIKKFLRGEEVAVTKEFLQKNSKWNLIRECAIDFGTSSSKIKKDYNAIKKETDEIIKNIKKAQRELEDGNKKGFAEYISGLKSVQMYMTAFSSATIACINEQVRFSVMLSLKLSLAWKKKEESKAAEEKKENVKESAMETTKFESELATLFDF